jgi:hypothetical protein
MIIWGERSTMSSPSLTTCTCDGNWPRQFWHNWDNSWRSRVKFWPTHQNWYVYIQVACNLFLQYWYVHQWYVYWTVMDIYYALFFPVQMWIWNDKVWLYFHLSHAHYQKLFFFYQTYSSWIVTDNKGQGSMTCELCMRYAFCFIYLWFI